jgi:hypothetical protein
MKNIILLCSLPFIIFACGSSDLNLEFHSPSVKFQSPETTGRQMGGRAQFSIGTAHEVSMARSSQTKELFSSNPSAVTITEETTIDPSWHLGYSGHIGIIPRIDFYVQDRGEAAFKGGFQFQVYGGTPSDKGMKISISAGGGYYDQSELSTSDLFSDPDDFSNVTGKIINRAWESSLIIGNRVNENIILYLNLNMGEDDISSHIQVSGQTRIELDNRFKSMGALIGAIVERKSGESNYFLQAEGGFSNLKSRFGVKSTHKVWGLASGIRF